MFTKRKFSMQLASSLFLIVTLSFGQKSTESAAKPLKIYLLAGQSNMVGYTSKAWVKEHAPKLFPARDDVWCFWQGRCRPLAAGAGHEVGPELSIGHGLGSQLEEPVLLCKFAVGGTTLNEHWRSPAAVKRAGGEIGHLYKRMLKGFHRILADPAKHCAAARGREYELAGFIWFQGENDCFGGREKHYEANLADLIQDLRTFLGTPTLPAIIVQINDSGAWDQGGGGGPGVREAQRKVAAADPHAALVKTLDLGEGYHYSDGDHVTIGRRVAEVLLPFAKRRVVTQPGALQRARAQIEDLFFPGRGPKPPEPDLYLSEFDWVRGTAGYGGDPKKNRSIEGRPLRIDGKRYAMGIGTHAESELVYRLDPALRRFVAVARIDDEMGGRDVSSVVFRVIVDGKLLAESVVLKAQEYWHFDVAIPKGAREITLAVGAADSGINSDHADWVDAGFIID